MLRLTAVRDGWIDITQAKRGAWTSDEAQSYVIRAGDYLVVRGNGSMHLVGRGATVRDDADVAYPDTLIRVRLDRSVVVPSYFALMWNTPLVRAQIARAARTTAGIYKVNQRDLGQVTVPVPRSVEDQMRIHARAAHQLEAVRVSEAALGTVARRSKATRSSILAAAFSGELVPQNNSDEPASALLQHIASERSLASSMNGRARVARAIRPKGPSMRATSADPSLKADEWAAAGILANLLDAGIVPRDIGGANGLHDFDLAMNDGSIMSVEVAQLTSERAAASLSLTNGDWDSTGLTLTWHLRFNIDSVKPPARNQLKEHVRRALVTLEAHKVGRILDSVSARDEQPSDQTEAVNHAIDALRRAGILEAFSSGEGPGIIVLTTGGGFAGAAGLPLKIAALAAEKMRRSLGKASGERHLFLWLDHWLAVDGIALGTYPPPPALPDGLSAVWLCEPTIPLHHLRRSTPSGWHEWQVPAPVDLETRVVAEVTR